MSGQTTLTIGWGDPSLEQFTSCNNPISARVATRTCLSLLFPRVEVARSVARMWAGWAPGDAFSHHFEREENMSSKSRVGVLVIAAVVSEMTGCNQGTEIPLAKVPPVTLTPSAPPKGAPKGAVVSPDVLPSR